MSLSNQITKEKLRAFLNLVLTIAPQFESYPGFQLLVRKADDNQNLIFGGINNWSRFEKKLYRKLLKAVKEEINGSLNTSMFRRV